MPNRIIKESIRTSPTLAQLSHGAERLFHRLVTFADDHGRFEAETFTVMGACMPQLVARGLRPRDVNAWMIEMERVGLITHYRVRGRLYGFLVSWAKHQRVRAEHSKYPDPTPEAICPRGAQDVSNSAASHQVSEINGAVISGHPRANAPVVGSRSRESRIEVENGSVGFEEFWQQYPKKVGTDEAQRAWRRIVGGQVDPALILAALERQLSYLTREGGKYIPNPATWLNQGRWKDHPPAPRPELNATTSANLQAARDAIERHRERRP